MLTQSVFQFVGTNVSDHSKAGSIDICSKDWKSTIIMPGRCQSEQLIS